MVCTEGVNALNGTWGGEECWHFVPLQIRLFETLIWSTMAVIFRPVELLCPAALPVPRTPAHVLLAGLGAAMLCVILLTKIQKQVLVWVAMPCHLVCLHFTTCLCFPGSTYARRAMPLILTWIFVCLMAVVFPDLSGLNSIEVVIYYVEHIFVLVVPVFLLYHRVVPGQLQRMTWADVGRATFCVICGQWFFYEPLAVWSGVNISFRLCPTDGMTGVLEALGMSHDTVLSFRSTLGLTLVPACIVFSIFYRYLGNALPWPSAAAAATAAAAAPTQHSPAKHKHKGAVA